MIPCQMLPASWCVGPNIVHWLLPLGSEPILMLFLCSEHVLPPPRSIGYRHHRGGAYITVPSKHPLLHVVDNTSPASSVKKEETRETEGKNFHDIEQVVALHIYAQFDMVMRGNRMMENRYWRKYGGYASPISDLVWPTSNIGALSTSIFTP